MKRIVITIDTTSPAFNDSDPYNEAGRILRDAADAFENMGSDLYDGFPLEDKAGKQVGKISVA